ncbi:hypothetical protein N431DRAFT_437288 [Stipitochalara longipes BDJ]|nr:hypothetical protein N431DRAFT_437288 [Stipitochalara longipes BDJ]
MDFGSPVGGDCVMLAQLAWDCLQSSRDAVGENDELTRELLGLYKILSRLQNELANPTSLVNRAHDERRQELEEHAADCEGILKVMNTVLEKYNALGRGQRKRMRLWQKIKFGNGEVKDLREVRNELSAHTSAITMGFNLCALHSPGKVETTLEMAEEQSRRHGRSLRGIRTSLHWVIANLSAELGEGSVRSSYANDDKTFSRTLRKELVKEGYDNYELQKHRRLIKAYVEELVNRGVLDDQEPDSTRHIPRPRLHKVRSNFYLQGQSRIDTWSPTPPETHRPFSNPTMSPKISPSVSDTEDVEMADVSTNEDETEDMVLEDTPSPTFDTQQGPGPQFHDSDDSDLSSSTLIEEIDDHPDPLPSKGNTSPIIYTVQIDQIINEDLIRYRKEEVDDEPCAELLNPATDTDEEEVCPSDSSKTSDEEDAQQPLESANEPVIVELSPMNEDEIAVREPVPQRPPPVQIEDILDEDFVSGAHPNVFLFEDTTSDSDAERPPIVEKLPQGPSIHASSSSMPSQKGPLKRVRWAEDDALNEEQRSSPCKYAPEDLPFIFHREFRDFDKYQELQESSQAMMDEKASKSRRKRSKPSSRISSFVTQKEYIPPATLNELQYYRIPASYFHKFWHPTRVPMYLHGNVFDGISFTHWIYGWTAYTFRDDSFEMSTVKRFGKQVTRLGSAMTDIENADDSVKRKLPRSLYDESGRLWETLENIVNDIMAESEDRLVKKRRGGRLEAEFVTRFCREIIAGDKYYRPIETWLKQTDDWCRKVRFHKDFVMLWDLWAV